MLNSSVKAVFFDLYGTLLVFNDFDEANNKWTDAFYELAGKPNNVSFEEVRTICKEILESDTEKEISKGFTTYETKIFNAFLKKNISIEKDRIKIIADTTVELWQENVVLADDALFVLSQLKKTKKLVLITNFDHSPHIYKVLNQTGLINFFDLVLISDEAGSKKPEPAIFRSALNYFSLNPGQAVYIGDNVYDDVMGAFNAGIVPILISRDSKSNNHNNVEKIIRQYNLAEFRTVKSLSELFDLHK